MFDAVALAEDARKAAGTDVSLASDGELLAAALAMSSERASSEAAWGHLLAELEVRGVCDREFGLTTASWLAHETHASRTVIAGQVKTAVKVRQLPVVDDALSDGAISSEHARVIAAVANPRIAADIVELQDELVGLAQRSPFPAWRRHVTELADLLDQDGGYDPTRELARNHVHVTLVGSDTVAVSGELVGEYGLSFRQLLDDETDRQWRARRADHERCPELEIPTRSTLRALALVELVRQGAAGSAPPGRAPVVDVTLLVRADEPEEVRTLDGVAVSRDVARHLCCDASFTPISVDHDGVPLDAGRDERRPNRAQRRALAVRDSGCTFPGCDAPASWCDAHHVLPWGEGGLTDLSNLALLCRYHHGVTHRHGWTMTATADETFTWTTPSGRTLTSQRNRGDPRTPCSNRP